MSIPIRSMSASRFSTEVNWIRLRSACSRLTCRVRWLAYSSRGWRVAAAWPATISAAFGVSTWQWMSTVNHLPRACTGPGKRPGISAPGGRHLNSISVAPRSTRRRDFDVQQPRSVAAEDRPALGVVEPCRTLDKADRVDLAHIGGIIGAHQNVVGAILFDEILELV